VFKNIVFKIPRLKALREEVEFLKSENKNLLNHCRLAKEEINFLKFRAEELDILHDEVVLRNWNDDQKRKKYMCKSPFERIEILPTGEVYSCCSAHLKHNFHFGNIYTNTLEEIWNSENAKKLRYSVTMGDFEYCNHMCRWLHNPENTIEQDISPVRLREASNFKYNNYNECTLDYMPREISLSCDETCNLTCPSCRTKYKGLNKEKSDLLYERLMLTVRPMLKGCKHLSSLGSGDIFASSAISRFYKTLSVEELPQLKLLIITNAQLLNEEKWKEFSNLKGMKLDLVISVDAAEKETYEKIRRGGTWENLNNNLKFISRLREKGEIQKLSFNFLVQNENYKQIEKFMLFAKAWNVDVIEFQKMANWGTFEDKSFVEQDVLNVKNEKYEQVCNILKDSIGKTHDIKIIQNIF
jgi:radical SAM protein with 4Fe4S-binding SPASM domain